MSSKPVRTPGKVVRLRDFAPRRRRSRRPAAHSDEPRGIILLFTGVRYQRAQPLAEGAPSQDESQGKGRQGKRPQVR